MRVTLTNIPDVLLLEPQTFTDERGFFYESYNQRRFSEIVGHSICFVQDNHSRSVQGTLRGLHYQVPPHEQGKLVRATLGEVFDVAVDIRHNSATFGQWVGELLSDENKRQLWIPPGFAHGFLVMSAVAEFQYKCTDFYEPAFERSIHYADPMLGINWPLDEPILSAKDSSALPFAYIKDDQSAQ